MTRRQGSIRVWQNSGGTFSAQARLPRRPGDKSGVLLGTFSGSTEKDAKELAADAIANELADLRRGKAKAGSQKKLGVRLADAVEDYIERRANDVDAPIATNTLRNYRRHLESRIRPKQAYIGEYKVQDLDVQRIEKWASLLTEPKTFPNASKGFSASTIHEAKKLVYTVLNDLENRIDRYEAPRPPRKRYTKASRSRNRNSASAHASPTYGEVANLVAHPHRWEDRVFIAVLAFGGLRLTEAASLTAKDVDVRRRRLRIDEVFLVDQGMLVAEPPKAGEAASIVLPSDLFDLVVELKKVSLRSPDPHFLFRSSNPRKGGHGRMDTDNWRQRVWVPARDAVAEIDGDGLEHSDDVESLQIKDLRAFTASFLVDSGATIVEAQAALRHADAPTTLKHYARGSDAALGEELGLERLQSYGSLQERLDAVWGAWQAKFPDQIASLSDPAPKRS